MKKLLAMTIVGAVVATASADISQFSWSGANNKFTVVTNTYIYTILDADSTFDMFAYVTAGQIDISDLMLFSAYNTQMASVLTAPPVNAGKWATGTINGTGAVAGKYAFAINGTSATFGGIAVGDTIKIFQVGGPINDLQPGGTGGVALPQIFTPAAGLTSVTVIPEPATALLFGIGAMGAWMVRRNKIRSKEQADA